MAYDISTLTLAGGGGVLCHYQMLDKIKALAESVGWVTQRYDNVSTNHEWIGKAPGLSGSESIYCGFRTYHDVSNDYYNLLAGVFTGYVSSSTFDLQPNACLSGIPAHNNAITYFMQANGQKLNLCMKVGTPVYEHGYIGKFLPYARPGEFPAPYFCGGMLQQAAATRYSDANHQMPYYGYRSTNTNTTGYARGPDGVWKQLRHIPWNNRDSAAYAASSRPADVVVASAVYSVEPIVLYDQNINVYGELDGVFQISGFNNGVENVVQIGGSSVIDQTGMTVLQAVQAILAVSGRAFVVLQSTNRTGFGDYIAMEMK